MRYQERLLSLVTEEGKKPAPRAEKHFSAKVRMRARMAYDKARRDRRERAQGKGQSRGSNPQEYGDFGGETRGEVGR